MLSHQVGLLCTFAAPLSGSENLPLNVRLRAAIKAAPYEHAKLTAVAVGYMSGDGFAAQLDRAIERSQRPMKLIEAKPVERHSPEEMQESMKGLRRY